MRAAKTLIAMGRMTEAMDWQGDVGRNWAEAWRLTDRSFSGLTQRLLERVATLPGGNVLDIGCGAGELALALARMRPSAEVTGIDVSPDLIAAARQRGGERALVRFDLADAAQWQPPRGKAPDLLMSRHGVMFFADPLAAFSHLRRVSGDGANLIFSCFRALQQNAWAAEIADLLPGQGAPAPGYVPGPFAFADPDFVRELLEQAGWKAVALEPVDFAYIAGQGDDPLADAEAFFARIGPFAAALRGRSPVERLALGEGLRAVLERNLRGTLVAFPAAAWIVTARNG